jgi:hypothetical protein
MSKEQPKELCQLDDYSDWDTPMSSTLAMETKPNQILETKPNQILESVETQPEPQLTAVKRRSNAGLWIEPFLAAYAERGTVRAACKAANVSRQTYTKWLQDPDFAQRVADAKEDFADHLEEILFDIMTGKSKGQYVPGMFLLKGKRPEYKDGTSVAINNNLIDGIHVDLMQLDRPGQPQLPPQIPSIED